MSIVDDIAEEHIDRKRKMASAQARGYVAANREAINTRARDRYHANAWMRAYYSSYANETRLENSEDVLSLPDERLCGLEEAENVVDYDRSINPEECAVLLDIRAIVLWAMSVVSMSPRMRGMLWMTYGPQQLSLEEIARPYGISRDRVKQIETRARARLAYPLYELMRELHPGVTWFDGKILYF